MSIMKALINTKVDIFESKDNKNWIERLFTLKLFTAEDKTFVERRMKFKIGNCNKKHWYYTLTKKNISQMPMVQKWSKNMLKSYPNTILMANT